MLLIGFIEVSKIYEFLTVIYEVAKSAEKEARKSAQMGATWIINIASPMTLSISSSCLTLKGETSYNIYPCFFFPLLRLDFNR